MAENKSFQTPFHSWCSLYAKVIKEIWNYVSDTITSLSTCQIKVNSEKLECQGQMSTYLCFALGPLIIMEFLQSEPGTVNSKNVSKLFFFNLNFQDTFI